MNATVYLIIVGGIFGILPIIWKSKGAYVFMLLCAGNLLSASLGGPLTNEIRDVTKAEGVPVLSIVRGVLLLLPPLLVILISRHSVKKKRASLHFLPAIAAGILAYLWFIRVLPFEQFSPLDSANLTHQLMRARDGALVAGILSCLALLYVERPKPEDEKKHKKH